MIYFTQKEREQVRREHAALAAVVLDAIEVTAALAGSGAGPESKAIGSRRTRPRVHGPFAEGWQDAASAIVAGTPTGGGEAEPSKPGRARRKFTRSMRRSIENGGEIEGPRGIAESPWRGTRDQEVDACLAAFGRWCGARAAGIPETDCAIKLDAFELFDLPDLENPEADPDPDPHLDPETDLPLPDRSGPPGTIEPRCAASGPPVTRPSSAPPG